MYPSNNLKKVCHLNAAVIIAASFYRWGYIEGLFYPIFIIPFAYTFLHLRNTSSEIKIIPTAFMLAAIFIITSMSLSLCLTPGQDQEDVFMVVWQFLIGLALLVAYAVVQFFVSIFKFLEERNNAS